MIQHDSLYLQRILTKYLTFPHEKILFAKRQSLLTLIPTLLVISLLSLALSSIAYPAFIIFLQSPYLFLVTLAVISLTAIFLAMKQIIEWYYHIYIITDKKLVEVKYVPLSSYVVNDVLLDQVQCTEIDIRMKGFISEVFDIGDIAITFDRPTHQEEFTLSSIGSVREIGAYLTNQLIRHSSPRQTNIFWSRDNKSGKSYPLVDLRSEI